MMITDDTKRLLSHPTIKAIHSDAWLTDTPQTTARIAVAKYIVDQNYDADSDWTDAMLAEGLIETVDIAKATYIDLYSWLRTRAIWNRGGALGLTEARIKYLIRRDSPDSKLLQRVLTMNMLFAEVSMKGEGVFIVGRNFLPKWLAEGAGSFTAAQPLGYWNAYCRNETLDLGEIFEPDELGL